MHPESEQWIDNQLCQYNQTLDKEDGLICNTQVLLDGRTHLLLYLT